jgi:hypothetical protein
MAVNDKESFSAVYNVDNRLYVEADYDNIILIDPNKVVDGDNKVKDRLVQQENLVMYANLETKIIPRTKLAIGDDFDNPVNNTTIASLGNGQEDLDINFLKPKGKKSFDTSWSDEFTGRGSLEGKGLNQNAEFTTGEKGNQTFKRKVLNYEDTQTLGITNIKVQVSSVGVPTVTMTLVDIRGRSLFEQGDNSIYSVFFNLPYPTFYLTLKGYYGKAIRYQLTLLSFNAKFSPESGNFEIDLKLMGRNSAILADSIVAYGKHQWKMFPTQVTTEKKSSSSDQTGVNKSQLQISNSSVGYQKLSEVYKVYKSKNLIAKDFPEITMETFIERADRYEQNIKKRIEQKDFDVINDINSYQKTLNEIKQKIYIDQINNNLDVSERLVYNQNTVNTVYYPYLESIKRVDRDRIQSELEATFNSLKEQLEKNTSFGKNAEFKSPKKDKGKQKGEINVNLNFNDIIKTVDYSDSNIDFKKTFELVYGRVPSDADLEKFIADFRTLNIQQFFNASTGAFETYKPTYYFYGEKPDKINDFVSNSFLDKLDKINKELEDKRKEIENDLTEELANMLINNDDGLGFTPSIRNIFAVLFAGLDAFYRMMDDTHTKAWEKKTQPARLNAILSPEKSVGVDNIDNVSGSNSLDKDRIVYPWPQYFEKERQQDGSELYVIKYPGDATSVKTTKGYNSTLWPEIEFTEEFIRAELEKNPPQIPQVAGNTKSSTDIVPTATIEFPFNTIPYQNLESVNFLYEIFERSYLSTHYTNINRGNYKTDQIDKFFADIDAQNIIITLENTQSPTLNSTLKNRAFNYETYVDYLKNISANGTGEYWTNYKNSTYNIEYIKNYIGQGYNKIYSFESLFLTTEIKGKIQNTDTIKNFINSTSSQEEYFLDPYPFTSVSWLKNNLQDGGSITTVNDFYKTTTLTFFDYKKTLLRDPFSISVLLNNYGFNNSTQQYITDVSSNTPVNSRDTLTQYYSNRNQKDLYYTESYIKYGNNYLGNVNTNIQTTSLINTPYFINALQKGVELSKTNTINPYVSLGYLYLNSLPLITTKEKLKKWSDPAQEPTEVDYLAATFNKFASLHELPYSWVLKYGSIWHRYKTYIETGVDILDDVWSDFNYKENYDPINSATTTQYSGDWNGGIVLQSSNTITDATGGTIINSVINVGFYPKVINDIYYYLKNQDLSILQNPSVSNFVDLTNEKGLKVIQTYNEFFNEGFDTNSLNRQLTVQNYTVYLKEDNNYILIPSMGSLRFNQSVFECLNNQNKLKIELFNNESVYNGTTRSLWSASQFGYFDNSLIKKPNYNQYIKTITTETGKKQNAFDLNDIDTNYSSIEEIFSIFEPNILDEFEKLFLTFCDKNAFAEDLILNDENTNATTSDPGTIKNVKQKSLYSQIRKLFLVDGNLSITSDDIENTKLIADQQIKNFGSTISNFLNFTCVLKMGNPSNFNRFIFNNFTKNPDLIPQPPFQFNPYVKGTLPGDGTPTTLLISQSTYPDEWNTLKKYVGEFDQNGIVYASTGSVITDFFIDNDIQFSVSYIQVLYPLIRLYAKEKLKDNTLNGVKFSQKINDFMLNQKEFNVSYLDETLRYLRSNLTNVDVKTQKIDSATAGNVSKLETYSILKTLNDKWIAGSNFTDRTLFEDFLFLDKANRDIGDTFLISVNEMNIIKDNPNMNYLSLVSTILEKNNFLFFAMPAYINFYGLQQAAQNGQPTPNQIPNSLFGTYLEVDYLDSRPKFVCTYVGKPSEYVASDASFVRFKDDAFDLRKYETPLRADYPEGTDFSKVNKVVAFAVDYGTQNQSIFKSISVDMSEKKNTSEANRLISQLGDSVAGDKVAQQTVGLYSIYKSRSYTCSVESMGNAMIQPTMYFNLRHVPLFYGPYWIFEVNHSITQGKFDTSFKGVRMPLYSLPKPNSMLDSVNKSYLQYYKELILQSSTEKTTVTPITTNASDIVGQTPEGSIQGNNNVCLTGTSYPDLPFVDINTTHITDSEMKSIIKTNISSPIMQLLFYGLVKTKILNTQNEQVWSAPNNNFYNVSSTNVYNRTLVDTYSTSQVCITTALANQNKPTPMFVFDSFTNGLLFYNSVIKVYEPTISKLTGYSTFNSIIEKTADACSVFTLFYDQARYVNKNGGVGNYLVPPKEEVDFKKRIDEKLRVTNPSSVLIGDYNRYINIYKSAYNDFFS